MKLVARLCDEWKHEYPYFENHAFAEHGWYDTHVSFTFHTANLYPLTYACRIGCLHMVRYLIEIGADVHGHCGNNDAILITSKRGHYHILSYLLSNYNFKDIRYGRIIACLEESLDRRHFECFRLLLSYFESRLDNKNKTIYEEREATMLSKEICIFDVNDY